MKLRPDLFYNKLLAFPHVISFDSTLHLFLAKRIAQFVPGQAILEPSSLAFCRAGTEVKCSANTVSIPSTSLT